MCIYHYQTFTQCTHSQPSGQIEICQDFSDIRDHIEELEDKSGDYGPPWEPDQCGRFREKRKCEVRGHCSACETYIRHHFPDGDIELQDFEQQEEDDAGILSDDAQSVGTTRRSSIVHDFLQRPHTAPLAAGGALTYARAMVRAHAAELRAMTQTSIVPHVTTAYQTRPANAILRQQRALQRGNPPRRTLSHHLDLDNIEVPPLDQVGRAEQQRMADEIVRLQRHFDALWEV